MIFDAHSDVLSDVAVKTLKGENNILKKYHYDNLVLYGLRVKIIIGLLIGLMRYLNALKKSLIIAAIL